MTKYLQIARRASEKPPLSIQIYFRCLVASLFRSFAIRFAWFWFWGPRYSRLSASLALLYCLPPMRGLSARILPCNLLCGSANNCLLCLSLSLSLSHSLHLLFLLLFVVHKMRRLVANCCDAPTDNSPGYCRLPGAQAAAAAGRARFAFNIQIVTLTSEIYYCLPICSFSLCRIIMWQEYPVTCLCHT